MAGVLLAAATVVAVRPSIATAQTTVPTAAGPAAQAATASLPAVPSTWPSTKLELGLTDNPGGAAALHASGAYKFRYQYLCGGVNTGAGWATWNANAKFADYYVDDSVAVGITPVFIYYQLLQSSPAGGNEKTADLNNLKNASTMRSYWADVRLLFQHLGAYSQTIVVDIEPDLWGYIQFDSVGDAGSSIPAAVASSGDSDVAGLANNADGFAQAFVRLRNMYAPNVLLGYELSMWGTQNDPLAQNIPLDQIDALAARSTAFQQSLGAQFDLVFTDPTDRDADFYKIIYGDGGNSWWDATDYDRFNRYVGDFVRGVGLRMVLWQIPLGNTRMRAMDDTWGHYQDNHVETWFGTTASAQLSTAVNAGVVAMLFGGGAGGTTSASDSNPADGITDPAPINGNTLASYSADNDGGYFRHQVSAYYAAGPLTLPTPIPPTTSTYHALTPPVRVLDTRSGIGLSGKLVASTPRTFQVTGGMIPTGASAITGNVTVVSPSDSWAIYLGPDPIAKPGTSAINFTKGQITGNGLTVALNATAGTLSATYMANPGNTTDLVLDVTGYFTPDDSGATYHPVSPTRLLDTRSGNGHSGKLAANTPMTFNVTGRDPVPAGATAVTGNLTVVNCNDAWAIYLGPGPNPNPGTSTINFLAGEIKSNNLTVALDHDTGTLSATFMSHDGSTTDLVFDVTGYYTADGSGTKYVPITPARLLDTRSGNGHVGTLAANNPMTFTVGGRNVIPAGAKAVTGNVTVVNETDAWAVYLGPDPIPNPAASTINFVKGDIKSNGLAVALSGTGTLSATYLSHNGSTTDLVFDVTGYFVP